MRTYGFLGAILPYGNVDWEKLSIFLNLLIPKLPSSRDDDLSEGILQTITLSSYRNEAQEDIAIKLEDKTFDDYFTEVDHSESISEDRPGSMHLFTSMSEVAKYRRIKGDDELDTNNWYEYVEYVVKDGSTGKLKLKASLSKCGRTSVENDVEYIRQNVLGIFMDEEDE